MADHLGVVHVGGDEDDVLDRAIAQCPQDQIALDGEAGWVLLGDAEDARVGPGVVRGRSARRHRERNARDDHLPGGRRRGHAVEQPPPLHAAQHGLVGSVGVAIRAAILSRVQDEHVEQSAPAEVTVEASGLLGGPRDRPVIEKGLPSHRHQRLAGAREIVADLVIVPDREHRGGGVEHGRGLILAVVPVLVVEPGERRRDEVGAGHHVGPAAAVVGIHGVADEEEEVRLGSGHRAEDLVTALHRTAEPHAPEVAAPYEADASRRIGRRRRDEFSVGGHAVALHAVGLARPRSETGERDLAGEVARGRDGDARRRCRRRTGSAVGDGHRARTRAAHPQHRRRRRHVPDGNEHDGRGRSDGCRNGQERDADQAEDVVGGGTTGQPSTSGRPELRARTARCSDRRRG